MHNHWQRDGGKKRWNTYYSFELCRFKCMHWKMLCLNYIIFVVIKFQSTLPISIYKNTDGKYVTTAAALWRKILSQHFSALNGCKNNSVIFVASCCHREWSTKSIVIKCFLTTIRTCTKSLATPTFVIQRKMLSCLHANIVGIGWSVKFHGVWTSSNLVNILGSCSHELNLGLFIQQQAAASILVGRSSYHISRIWISFCFAIVRVFDRYRSLNMGHDKTERTSFSCCFCVRLP